MKECPCAECSARRESAARLQEIKKTLPKPEWDWEDLERQCREYRERVRRDPFKGGLKSHG